MRVNHKWNRNNQKACCFCGRLFFCQKTMKKTTKKTTKKTAKKKEYKEKSEKASLENKKLLFVEIGLVVSLAITLFAFEWTSTETETALLEDTTEILIEEEIISTQMETPPPPPEAPKIPVLSDQIDIVDDEIEIEDDMFMNLEDDASLGVEIMDYVEVVEEEVVEEAAPAEPTVEEKTLETLKEIKELLETEYKAVKLIILGPSTAAVAKVNNKYRFRMIIKCKNNQKNN